MARNVISVLNLRPDTKDRRMPAAMRERLMRQALEPTGFDIEAVLGELLQARMAPEDITDLCIPEVAREIGVLWVEDRLSFAQVSIASARLQGLVTRLSRQWPDDESDSTDVSALLVLQKGDSHTLGTHVAAAQLRRLGVSVRMLFGADEDMLLRTLSEERHDLVLFSCSRVENLETISGQAKRIKLGFPNSPPLVLGGIVLGLTDRVKERSGVDLVTNEVGAALKMYEQDKRAKRPAVVR
ncbi:hypothetical protein GCM10011324_07110 [Allosediminivita pacifica]|nr:hypothetical protein GCM10011324_07110 [Allosediminivita pacifica]